MLTIAELAERSGLERRTIRSYITEGLLAGAEKRGRGARYPAESLDRLRAIQVLKDERGLRLANIRQLLRTMSDVEIRAIAQRESFHEAVPPGPGSALAYLRNVRAVADARPVLRRQVLGAQSANPERLEDSLGERHGLSFGPAGAGREFSRVSPMDRAAAGTAEPPRQSPIERLLAAFRMTARRVPRKAHGDAWLRIPITPDIELHVRGVEDPGEVSRLERLADLIRHIMLGGQSND